MKAERPYQPGDQISYYVTGSKAKVKISESCKLASRWDAERPDENVEHYKGKLEELYEKFRPFIENNNQGNLTLEDRESRIEDGDVPSSIFNH